MSHEAPAPPGLIEDYVRHLEDGGALTPEEFLARAGASATGVEALESLRLAALLEREAPVGPAPGERLGPYRLERRLGTGGMGTVYLATVEGRAPGVAAGEHVAVKLVHPHLFQKTGYFSRFLREVEVGRRVRHDNVVRVLAADAIEAGGRMHHVLVMEYVEGRTLRELLGDLGTVPEALLREIALQVTDGLSAVHEAGVVHRDLKPENVLITDDHRVRIMDLGVARVLAETASLTREGEFIGSLAYAAPEQFRAGDVTAAADLYSLGVLLYELATGTNPFQRDEIPQLMAAHLNETPRRADQVNDELSAFLAELLATLLAKDASARFESAAHLRELLGLAERSPWWVERERALRQATTHVPRVPVQRQTSLYGREADLEMLRGAWERARRGEGNTVLLEGEAGIGKTRLVDAFLHGLAGEEATVLYGSYPPAGGMGGLSDAVIEHFGAGDLANSLAPYLSVTPSLVPAFAALLRHEPPPDGAEAIQGDALHAVFVHLMRGLAAEKPLVWVVDDLHFAGAEGRAVLLALARAAEEHRVLLLFTTRPGLPEGEVANFSRLQNVQRAVLARLSAREVIELLRDAVRSERLAERLGGMIAYKSDGVPFFVFEMIRGLKEGQFITQLPDGTWVETRVIERIEVPSAVRDLIEARLRDLTEEQRAVLDVGAVQGFSFDPDLVARVLSIPRLYLLRLLADVERRWGVVQGQAGSCRFDHHQIQEVLYEKLPPDLRAEYHSHVADAYAAANSGDLESGASAYFLAHHRSRGSNPAAAAPVLEAGLDHLLQLYGNDAAVELARATLQPEGGLVGEVRIEILLRLAKALEYLGRPADELDVLREARSVAEEIDARGRLARVYVRLGVLHSNHGPYDEAERCLQRAAELARAEGDSETEAWSTCNLSHVASKRGRYEEAWTYDEGFLKQARRRKDVAQEMAAMGNMAVVLKRTGQAAEAVSCRRRQLDLARQTESRLEEAIASTGLGAALLDLGRPADAVPWLATGARLAAEIGHRRTEIIALGNLGVAKMFLGEYAEAERLIDRRRLTARETGDPTGEAIACTNRGSLLRRVGRLEPARADLEHALELSRDSDDRWLEPYIMNELGALEDATGHSEAAERRYAAALEIARSFGNEAAAADATLGLARLAAARGAVAEARACLESAVEIATRIDAPEPLLLAECESAGLPDSTPDEALAVLKRVGDQISVEGRARARFLLWHATRDRTHLDEAARLTEFLADHAGEEHGEAMRVRVPLFVDVTTARELIGPAPPSHLDS